MWAERRASRAMGEADKEGVREQLIQNVDEQEGGQRDDYMFP